jgi:hypothetical protein
MCVCVCVCSKNEAGVVSQSLAAHKSLVITNVLLKLGALEELLHLHLLCWRFLPPSFQANLTDNCLSAGGNKSRTSPLAQSPISSSSAAVQSLFLTRLSAVGRSAHLNVLLQSSMFLPLSASLVRSISSSLPRVRPDTQPTRPPPRRNAGMGRWSKSAVPPGIQAIKGIVYRLLRSESCMC